MVFLTSCAVPQFTPPKFTEPPEVEWKKYEELLRKIPNVDKMDAWLVKVHKTDIPKPQRIVGLDGHVYIGYTPEDHKNLLKILRHGRFGWETAKDLQLLAETQQIVIQQVIFMAKLIEEQRDIYKDRWVDAENRYLQLEYKVKIDGIWHKITTIGLITGMILIGIAAL